MDYDLNIDIKSDGSVAVRQIQRVERSLKKAGDEADKASRKTSDGFKEAAKNLAKARAAASLVSAAIVAGIRVYSRES